MLLHRLLPLSLACFGLALAAPSAQADTTIDDFLTNDFAATTDTGEIAGGYRGTRQATATNGTIAQTPGFLIVTASDDDAIGAVLWPPTAAAGGPVLDTPPDDQFELGVVSSSGSWTATIFADDGTKSGMVMSLFLPSGVGTVRFSFDNPLFNGVDFGNVQQLKLILQEVSPFEEGHSVTIDYLRVVPEPSTAGMLLLGLFGLGAAGRARRARA
jgi:hypothetical protein